MSTSTTEGRSGTVRMLTYASCAFAVVTWLFAPLLAIASSLVCIALLAARTPDSAVERWIVQLFATAAFCAAVAVWFATPVGI